MVTVEPMTREMFDTYIQALLNGEKKPLNDTVGYLIEKYREARIRYQSTSQTVAKLDHTLKAAREELLRSEGEVNSYATDLEHFCGVEPRSDQPGGAVPQMPVEGANNGRDKGKTEVTPAGIPVTD